MALRLLEIFVPAGSAEKVMDVLRLHADGAPLGVWQYHAADETVRTSLLIPAEGTEAVMDLMQQHFSTQEGFRMIVVPVEASVPRPQQPPPPADTANAQAAHPTPRRISRQELYADIAETVKLSPVFFGLVILSTIVAAFGLMRNNIAVIVGAMVIAPLLGPNIALALATTLGDGDLARRVGLEDIALALAAGGAGALSFTTGISTALVGVMVAVALLPPLATAGMLLGAGDRAGAAGAALLLLTNIICVNLAAVGAFLVQGIRPMTWWESHRAARSTRIAIVVWGALLAVLTTLILIAQVR